MNANIMEHAGNLVNNIVGNKTPKVKVIKKERGLLEREENEDEKLILAEDNRQILFG